jgi:alpha-galactosidase
MMAWVTDSPNPLTGRRLPLSFRFHVAMTGALGIGGDLMTWTEADLDEAQGLLAQYKAARHVIQLGEQHRLASTRHGDVGAVQCMTQDGAEVVLLAYWGVRRYGPYPRRLQLTALDAAKSYRDRATGTVRSGAELMRFGLDINGPLDFGSVFAHLERLGG